MDVRYKIHKLCGQLDVVGCDDGWIDYETKTYSKTGSYFNNIHIDKVH